ncbi:MAG TPA: protein kinase [Candidatus Eremiobacteraeota bacterium]|nr:protein kinase [Candidatus Eremiobacteraeota bacterium]
MSDVCSKCGYSDFDEQGNCIYCTSYNIKWLRPGTILDSRYEIQKAIKAGGMGAVYKGLDKRLTQACAIKEMLNQDEDNLDYMKKKFLEEAKLLADLRHTGIPRVTDYFTENNRYYLIMDYLDGCDLHTYVTELYTDKGLDEATVVKWAIEICDILIYLHNQKPKPILHRDIKPSNVFLCYDGRIMLIDFGLARPINPDSLSEKTMIGTIGYAPLEQYQGHPETRSDIYSLGAVMHFLLSAVQSPPLKFDPITKFRPDVSPWLENIIKKAVSLYADNRFSSALEMKGVLEKNRDLGEYRDDSGDLEKVQKQIVYEGPSSRKGFLIHKKTFKEKTQAKTAENISDPVYIEKIMSWGEKSDERALESILQMLKSPKFADKHKKIVELLGNYKDEKVVDPLIKMLSHEDEIIRRYAPVSLARVGAKRAIKDLLPLLKDPQVTVQKSALKAIGELTDRHVIDFLSIFLTKDPEEYMLLFPKDESLYFNSIEELILNLSMEKDLLKCHVHLAALYGIEERYFQAEERIKKASQLKKDNIHITLLYADILARQRKHAEAIEVCDEVYIRTESFKIEDKLRELYYNYGRECEHDNNIEGALSNYQKAIVLNPSYKEKKFFESLIMLRKQKIKKGIRMFKKYMEENPEGTWYKEAEKIIEEIRNSPFPGIVTWLKGLF